MIAFFSDSSVPQNNDSAGFPNGGKTVGNDKSGAGLHQFFHGFPDETFALVIEVAGGLVE